MSKGRGEAVFWLAGRRGVIDGRGWRISGLEYHPFEHQGAPTGTDFNPAFFTAGWPF